MLECVSLAMQAVSTCTIETMAVTESGGGVVLGLGATSGAVFVAVPAAQVTWVALDTGPSAAAVKWYMQSCVHLYCVHVHVHVLCCFALLFV